MLINGGIYPGITSGKKALGTRFVRGVGAYKRSKIEKCFKTSYIAVLIKLIFEFTCLVKLHNVLKNLNSLQYKLEKGVCVCVLKVKNKSKSKAVN